MGWDGWDGWSGNIFSSPRWGVIGLLRFGEIGAEADADADVGFTVLGW